MRNELSKGTLRASERPRLIIELEDPRGDELLQRPATSKPPTLGQLIMNIAIIRREIHKPGIAHIGVEVEPEHGVDGLCQLRAAGLVDAAGVGPGVLQAILSSELAELLEFGEAAFAGADGVVGEVLEGDFLVFPGV